MSEDAFINILVAEDNEVTREMMAALLRQEGYNVIGAVNGESAIKVIQEHDVDMAFVDINMLPTGGFEFVKYLVSKGIKMPVVIVTGDESTDILMEATSLGVRRVLQKPVDPQRLVHTAHHILRSLGLNPAPLGVEKREISYRPEELMKRAIELANENAKSVKGGPFGALVADQDGRILGEGVNGPSSRVDPIGHAEIMAIRQAAEILGTEELSDCILYCSSHPTAMGHALIESVGIRMVYYGLSYEDVGKFRKHEKPAKPKYRQLGKDEALSMFLSWNGPDNEPGN